MRTVAVFMLLAIFPAWADGWQTLSGRSLSDAAVSFAKHELGMTVHAVRDIPERRLPSGKVELAARWLGGKPSGELRGRRFVVPVAVVVEGKSRETIAVLVEVENSGNTLMQSGQRPVAAASPVRDNKVPVTQSAGAVTPSPANNKVPVTQSGLAVRRGERVTVMCRRAAGGLQIEVEGLSRGDAAIGDVVRVQLEAPRRLVEARVVSARHAEMDL